MIPWNSLYLLTKTRIRLTSTMRILQEWKRKSQIHETRNSYSLLYIRSSLEDSADPVGTAVQE